MRTGTAPITALALAMLVAACGGDGEPTSTDSTASGPPAEAVVLFSDDFVDDRNAWGEVDDPEDGTAAFVDGAYVWALRGSNAHWLAGTQIDAYDAGELELPEAVVTAELTIRAGGGVAGVFCRESTDTDAEYQWYEFVVRDGFAAIRLADSEGNIEVLAEDRGVAVTAGRPVTIEATCRRTRLALAVDGDVVAEATVDAPLPEGGLAGLQAWTFPVHEQLDLTWHRFEVAAAG